MSVVGIKRIANYSGLAMGQGAQTISTSPLWSPDGAYNFGAIQTNPQHMGAIQLGAVHMGYAGEEQGIMDTVKGYYAQLQEKEWMGVSYLHWLIGGAAAYYLFFRQDAMYPIRLNSWSGAREGHQGAAKIRWGKTQEGLDLLSKYYKSSGRKPRAKSRHKAALDKLLAATSATVGGGTLRTQKGKSRYQRKFTDDQLSKIRKVFAKQPRKAKNWQKAVAQAIGQGKYTMGIWTNPRRRRTTRRRR